MHFLSMIWLAALNFLWTTEFDVVVIDSPFFIVAFANFVYFPYFVPSVVAQLIFNTVCYMER